MKRIEIKMNYKEQKLWNAIREFEMDDDEAVYTFSDRLAKENKWTKGFALRAIEEYKKFIFLVCTSHRTRTPSDAVDQVWHLHLLYTRSYWNDFCGLVLNRQIHHGPTRGGPEETLKFQDAYTQTLQHYRETFLCEPPTDLWPRPGTPLSHTRQLRQYLSFLSTPLKNEIIRTIKYYYETIITYTDTSRKSAAQKVRHRTKTRITESNTHGSSAQTSTEDHYRTGTI